MKSRNGSSPPAASVSPAAIACPPPATSSPLSFAASTAAPKSTPEIDRPEPLPPPSSVSAITIAGRPKRSLMRPATMPITPWCQPEFITVMTAAPLNPAACASACSQTSISIERRSSFSRSSSTAMARASSGAVEVSRRTPRSDLPTRPPALIRGPRAKPRSRHEGGLTSRAASASAASPTFCRAAMILSPCVTNARLRPLSRATSATVPSATRSSRSRILGSASASKKPRARSSRTSATPSRNAMPTAARCPCAAPSALSSSRLGLIKA